MNKLPGGMFAGALGIAGDCTMLSGLDGMLFPFIASHSLEERRDPVNVVLVAPVDTSNGLRDATRIGDTRSVAFFGAAPHGGASRHVVSAVARARGWWCRCRPRCACRSRCISGDLHKETRQDP